MIVTRDAQIEDVPAILKIYNHAVVNTNATFDLEEQTLEEREKWFRHYGGQYPLIVAELDDQIVGYASLSSFRTKPAYAKTAEISVYVDSDCHGKGIGKFLITEILLRAKQLRYHTIIAGITAGNEVSVALHERFGFRLAGTLAEVGYKFDKWQDVHFYQLIVEDD